MSGKSSRTKGHSFERKIARDFQAIGYPEAHRHLESQEIEAKDGVDLVDTGSWAVQCKRKKGYAPVSTLSEIKKDPCIKLVITKADNKPAVAIMYWDQLKDLIETWLLASWK